MRVAHVNISDLMGGADKACYRLHRGLLRRGINSKLFVVNKKSNDTTVEGEKGGYYPNRLQEKIDKLPLIFYRKKLPFFFSNGWLAITNLSKKISDYNPDIIHLHWIGNSIIPISKIPKFQKPIVWSLHDMWPFTGGCHYNGNCLSYSIECSFCPNFWNPSNYPVH